jgi:peroxiredoxin
MVMTYEEIKEAVLKLSDSDQKRLILEVIPQIWPKACTDDTCLNKIRELVDEDAVRAYREQHMGGI